MALAPRRTTEGLMIGLLFLICLMLTLKDIKKNVKRFLVFHMAVSSFLTGKRRTLLCDWDTVSSRVS